MTPPTSSEVLQVEIGHLAERVSVHDKTLCEHSVALHDMALWRARLQGQLAAYAAVGAVVGSLVPKLVEYLAK